MLELPSGWNINPTEIEIKSYLQQEIIVQSDDSDDSIIVVLEGSIGVYITVYFFSSQIQHNR